MTRKPQAPNWSRLARTARVEAGKLPVGLAKDALIAKARKLEAAGNRENPYRLAELLPPLGNAKTLSTS
jgi:hypothetical protein